MKSAQNRSKTGLCTLKMRARLREELRSVVGLFAIHGYSRANYRTIAEPIRENAIAVCVRSRHHEAGCIFRLETHLSSEIDILLSELISEICVVPPEIYSNLRDVSSVQRRRWHSHELVPQLSCSSLCCARGQQTIRLHCIARL